MASKPAKGGLEVKPQNRNGRSPSRSPGHRNRKKAAASKKLDYSSEGISDYDVLQLPVSDYKIVLLLTAVSVVVRLFRIYQPTSVVFDEVQYVATLAPTLSIDIDTKIWLNMSSASVDLRPNISMESFSWTYIPRSRKCSSPLSDTWLDFAVTSTSRKSGRTIWSPGFHT